MKFKPIFLLYILAALSNSYSLPRFEVYWESQFSYKYNDDEAHNPWYIDLDAIAVGPVGDFVGPNVVTIHAADYCVEGCQENYPDEFCSKYPPEGIPAKPRTVDDWGTKFNLTSHMMEKGIAKIHELGGKVNLAYGGQYQEEKRYGISAQDGGGSKYIWEGKVSADHLANRIAKNIADWDLDGVDFYFDGPTEGQFWNPPGSECCVNPGNSALYHLAVIKTLRKILPKEKTISYTTTHDVSFSCDDLLSCSTIMNTVIMAGHHYLDWISFKASSAFDDKTLDDMEELGIPLSKVGAVLYPINRVEWPSDEELVQWTDKIKARGLAGLSVFSINKENNLFFGKFVTKVAELLYL